MDIGKEQSKMPKVKYDGIQFDSELEVEYYKYLCELWHKGEVLEILYHPKAIENLIGKRSYTPDFCVLYPDRIEIIETKGYNPYSKMIDDQIHNVMLSKNQELRDWLNENYDAIYDNRIQVNFNSFRVSYKKVKYLKAYGFVDWDFKNPNTIANKRKEKINDLSTEIKALRDFKKDAERYFRYHIKVVQNEKLTKPQKEWYYNYVKKLREEYGNNNETN